MEDLKNILAEHPFFKGLNEEYFSIIVGCASNMRVDAGKWFTVRVKKRITSTLSVRER